MENNFSNYFNTNFSTNNTNTNSEEKDWNNSNNNNNINSNYNSLIPNCQICINPYDDGNHSPIVIQCGHTFCKTCVKRILQQKSGSINNNNNNSISLFGIIPQQKEKCPVCKKPISNNELVPNYELLSLISNSKRKLDNLCESHNSETLNFYCNNCKQLICQMCLLLNHIGHELKRPEDSDLNKSLETFSSFNSILKEVKEKKLSNEFELNTLFKSINSKAEKTYSKLRDLSNYIKLEQIINLSMMERVSLDLDELGPLLKKEYDSIIKKNLKAKISEEVTERFEKLKENYEVFKLKASEEHNNNRFSVFTNINNSIDELKSKLFLSNPELVNVESMLKKSSFSNMVNPIEYLLEQRTQTIQYDISKSSKDHLKLVDLSSLRTECESEFIINIMKSIDRSDFVPNVSAHTYSDTPLMIGWNTTISAPHMHMLTISYLSKILNENFILEDDKDVSSFMQSNNNNANLINTISNCNNNNSTSTTNINNNHITSVSTNMENIMKSLNIKKPFLKALDIGSGSGYMTLALSKMLGPNSRVYGIDHIEEIINYSKSNIQKNHKEYLDSEQIVMLTADGKMGYPEQSKYNVIHVGAAVQDFPQVLFDQLENEGYMWIPVGPKNAFKKIYLVYKNNKGEISKTELLTCSYAEMTTKEDQLSHLEEEIDPDNSLEESF